MSQSNIKEKGKDKEKDERGKEKEKDKKTVRRNFPTHTLEQTLEVAQAIQDKNAGKPIKPFLLADAIGIKASSSNFRTIASSAWKYVLTTGTHNVTLVGLTTLGSIITKPTGKEQETKARQEAVLKIESLANVLEFYRDKKLPSPTDNYFKNKLETDFGIERTVVDEFIRILVENGKYSGILRESQGSLYVDFAESVPEQQEETLSQEEDEEIPEGPETNKMQHSLQRLTHVCPSLTKYL